jgi:hypothetical protein
MYGSRGIAHDSADRALREARRPLNIQAFMALGEMHQLRRHGGSGDKPGRFPAPTGIFIAKVPEPPAGSPILLRKLAMFRPRAATTQNSGGTKPFSASAKTSGNRRWIPIDHQMKGRKGP